MRYKLFGNSGLRISELCLGTMTFGNHEWGTDESEAREIYKLFRDAGGNFFDTANEMYAEGRSEEILGRLVAGARDEAVIATKYSFQMPGNNNPNGAGNHRKSLKRSIESSLRRLNTDYVDVLWTHGWDGITPVEEVMRALDDLVRAGKVLYIGVSNTPAWIVAKSNSKAESNGLTPFVGTQIEYNLVQRDAERELLPMARDMGLTAVAYSPLANGMLSGKYHNSQGGDNRRLDKIPKKQGLLNKRNLDIARAVGDLAGELGRTSTQVALNWLRARPGVIPLFGARTIAQLKDNIACLEFTLEPDHITVLDDIAKVELGYPHDFLVRTEQVRLGGFKFLLER